MRTNVRSAVPHRTVPRPFSSGPLLLLLAVLWAGCGSESAPREAPGGSQFGDDYQILTSETPATPDEPPALRGDTLAATVGYRGGTETHTFTLRHQARGDTTRLWLHHDSGGDTDSARVLDDVRLPVPPEALRPSAVVLMNPQGGEPFVLRWSGEDNPEAL